jgi:hypothetical protein
MSGVMGGHEPYGEHGRTGDEPLRGLTAPGPSRVGTVKAMRARDVSRADVAGREGSRGQGGSAHSVGEAGSSGSSPVDS